MSRRPGGELATRPLHFFWICDCSGSMSIADKMQSLNDAIRNTLPHMREVADDNPHASVIMRCLKFSHGAGWHVPEMPLQRFVWADLVADPLPQASVDIMFMLDTSGSMHDEIEAVKASCTAFADHIIKEGANVRLGLIGFDIGGHHGGRATAYTVHNLSTYTIGVWPLTTPAAFKPNIQSLSLGLFGGGGCYLANYDTIDMFPQVIRAFDGPPTNTRVLVIISDEIGGTEGLSAIVAQLKQAGITSHVLGVPERGGAHESIARATNGTFWDITRTRGVQDFGGLLEKVATTIAQEVTKQRADGTLSAGTDMGAALHMIADQLTIPPMSDRALPPVLVLISDGQPTDDFAAGLKKLMAQPWGKKAVRIAIAVGHDADLTVLRQFISHADVQPLQANNPEALVAYVKWASTAVLKSASAPASGAPGATPSGVNVPIPAPPDAGDAVASGDVW